MTTKTAKKGTNNYKVVLKTVGKEYKATGETVYKAIGSLGLTWVEIKNKGTMTIYKGDKAYEHLFYLRALKRIFANKYSRLLWGKRLELLLSLQ